MASERLAEVCALLRAHGLLDRVPVLAVSSGSSVAVVAQLLADVGDAAASARLRLAIDPRRVAYSRFGAARGVINTFSWHRSRFYDNLRGLLLFPTECCRGRVPGVNAGDPWAQGAAIVLSPATPQGGRAQLYVLRETAPGWPRIDIEAVVTALRRALPAPKRQRRRSAVQLLAE